MKHTYNIPTGSIIEMDVDQKSMVIKNNGKVLASFGATGGANAPPYIETNLWRVPDDRCHPSHKTRSSDASTFDEICVNCGARDIAGGGWGNLRFPCKEAA